MNFLENLPGGRAGEANRSDPQSGVSRLIPVNLPVPAPVPEITALRVWFCRPSLRGPLPAAFRRGSFCVVPCRCPCPIFRVYVLIVWGFSPAGRGPCPATFTGTCRYAYVTLENLNEAGVGSGPP